MLTITDQLPTAEHVRTISREELAGYILEGRNAEAAIHYHGEEQYKWAERDFRRWVSEQYRNNDVVDCFASAFQWMQERGYVTEDHRDLGGGWYRITALGRTMKTRDQVPQVRVPREINPGPAPDFRAIMTDVGLAKHLHVVWEEAVLCLKANAHLATVIMLGSLLEGALLGRALDKPEDANRAKAAPRNDGKVLSFYYWGLGNFIDVATECGWIHGGRGDYAVVLRDYRNLIHPNKAKDVYFVDHGMTRASWEVVLAALRDLGLPLP